MKRLPLVLSLVITATMVLILPSAYAADGTQYAPVASVESLRVPVGDGGGKVCKEIILEDKDSGVDAIALTLRDNIEGVTLEGRNLCVSTSKPLPTTIVRLQATDPDKNTALFEATLDVYLPLSAEKEAGKKDTPEKDVIPDSGESRNESESSGVDIAGSVDNDQRHHQKKKDVSVDDPHQVNDGKLALNSESAGSFPAVKPQRIDTHVNVGRGKSADKKAPEVSVIPYGSEHLVQAKRTSPALAKTGVSADVLPAAWVTLAICGALLVVYRRTRH